jgi:hypothetical protein
MLKLIFYIKAQMFNIAGLAKIFAKISIDKD